MSSIRLPKQIATNIAFEPDSNITSTDVQSALTEVGNGLSFGMSTCLQTSCVLTINADPAKYDIPSFTAVFVDNYSNPLTPIYLTYTYPGSTANTLTNLATQDATFISINSSGTILQTVDYPTALQLRDYVLVGGLTHTSRTSIGSANVFTATIGSSLGSTLWDLGSSLGPINKSGNIITGNATNTLRVNKTAGESFQVGFNIGVSNKSPNISTDAALVGANFFLSWRDGAGNFTIYITNTITPGKYDNNTVGGTVAPLGTVTNNRWQLFKVYHTVVTNLLVFEAGQTTYTSYSAAVADKETTTIVNPAVAPLKFRGWFAIRGGATNLNLAADGVFIDCGKLSQSVTGGAQGSSTTTIQGTYNNSTTPEILTDATRGALSIKNGQAADTATVFEGQNIAGTNTFSVTGSGQISATKLTVTSTTEGIVFPNMTTTQKNVITATAGCVVFDTTLSKLCVYNGAAWQTITSV